MIPIFQEFLSCFQDQSIQVENRYLNKVIQQFSFYFFIKNAHDNTNEIIKIQQRNTYKDIFISEYIENKQKYPFGPYFYLICIEKTIIIIEQTEIDKFCNFFSQNQQSTIYTLSENTISKLRKAFNLNLKFSNEKENQFLINQISSLTSQINFNVNRNKYNNIKQFVTIIKEVISGFLIKKSINKSIRFDRISHFEDYSEKYEEKPLKQDKYIKLNSITNNIFILYHIKLEQLFVLKVFADENADELFERERLNYLKIHFPFFPKYIGTTEYFSHKAIIIEYIHGEVMNKQNIKKFNKEIKLKIIFQIMVGFLYLHSKELIYSDLKPNNIIINKKGSIYIIGFDKIIINDQPYSTKYDIYSIGNIIEFVFSDELSNNDSSEYSSLHKLVDDCRAIDEPKQPNITNLINRFYIDYISSISYINETDTILYTNNIHNHKYINFWFYISEFNHPISHFNLGKLHENGIFYLKNMKKAIDYFHLSADKKHMASIYCLINFYLNKDINKALKYLNVAANLNDSNAQWILGYLYYSKEYINQDINKAIHYFTLAANQNHSEAQFYLGKIYLLDNYNLQDINKAIHYFTLAANQNHSDAQFILGFTYIKSKKITKNIDKSIYYLTQAANQNHAEAQFILGLLYIEVQDMYHDITKSIFYLQLASNQNHVLAQYSLGCIYLMEQSIKRDINKSIHYFTLAAKQNYVKAQYNLGLLYFDGLYIPQNLNKSIYYFTLASNQNFVDAMINLGLIYYEKKFGLQDINKSIYYFTLASNQNSSIAQFNLGVIYEVGGFIQRDINKSIHYYSLAAKQNNMNALYNLGLIYENGEFISKDIKKSINYFILAAKLNNSSAQFKLGYYYLIGEHLPKDIKKSIYYLLQASDNNFSFANFFLGCIFCSGEYFKRDFNEAIKYFKKSSSFNDEYSKNNLGVIYKNVMNNTIAIEYFDEAIRQKNNKVAMYNLGNIYFYGNFIEKNIDKSIDLLIKSSNKNFNNSKFLLSLIIIKKISSLNLKNISVVLQKYGNKNSKLSKDIYEIIQKNKLIISDEYEFFYSMYKNVEFFYNYEQKAVLFSDLIENNTEKNANSSQNSFQTNNINKAFYDGFKL